MVITASEAQIDLYISDHPNNTAIVCECKTLSQANMHLINVYLYIYDLKLNHKYKVLEYPS